MFTMIKSCPAKTRRGRGSGFTLVEILAVIVLICMVAGAAGGIYFGTYQRRLFEQSAAQIMLAAKYARTVAVEKQRPCRMYLDQDRENARVYLTIDSIDRQTEILQETIIKNQFHKPANLAGQVKYEGIFIQPGGSWSAEHDQQKNNVVVFTPEGTADAALVQIGNGQRHGTIFISPATGRARLFLGTADAVEIQPDTIDLDEK